MAHNTYYRPHLPAYGGTSSSKIESWLCLYIPKDLKLVIRYVELSMAYFDISTMGLNGLTIKIYVTLKWMKINGFAQFFCHNIYKKWFGIVIDSLMEFKCSISCGQRISIYLIHELQVTFNPVTLHGAWNWTVSLCGCTGPVESQVTSCEITVMHIIQFTRK